MSHRITDISFLIVAFAFHLLSGQAVFSQYTHKPFVVYFEKDDYHAGNQNWSVTTDDHGIAYIGNNDGMLTFDGSNWNLFPMPDGLVVRSVLAGPDQHIYVGSFEEFGYFSPNHSGSFDYTSLSRLTENGGLHNDEIWRILIHNKKVYFQSFSHIYVYDGEKVKVIDPGGTIVLFMQARNRLFVHKVGSGLYELKQDSLFLVRGSEDLAGDEVKAVLPFGEKDFLVGASDGGLFVMDSLGFQPLLLPVNKALREAEINNGIALDSFLIIGTIVDGLYILNRDGSLKDHLNTENFLPNNTVLSLRADGNSSFWAGLDRGIGYVSMDNPLDFYIDPSRSSRTVFSAALTDTILWVGTNQGVFKYRYIPSTGYSQPRLVEGTQGQVWDLSIIDGKLYCGHTNGTYQIENDRLRLISDINGGYKFKKIFTDQAGEILLQSSYSVFSVFRRKEGSWMFDHVIPGFYEPVPEFEFDHNGYLWASHASKGIYRLRFDPSFEHLEGVRYFGRRDGLPTDRNIMVALVDHRIVFSTREKIYTFNDLTDSIVPYEMLNKALGDFAASGRIVAVGDDKYWCIAGNMAGFFQIADGKVTRLFSCDLSMQGADLGSSPAGVSRLADDLYLLSLDNGFAIYNARNPSPGTASSMKPVIRSVRAYDKQNTGELLFPRKDHEPAIVPYASRNVEFTFSVNRICYSPVFSWQLAGLDDQWSSWSESAKTYYTRLPAGDYQFLVKIRRTDGSVSEPEVFSFRIRKPGYASLPALTVYILALITGIFILRAVFVRRLKLHTQRMQALEKEKRRRDKIIAQQDLIKLRNEKLREEVSHKNIQLANYTMSILRKNELFIRLREEIMKQKKELGGRYPNYHYDRLIEMIDRSISSEDDWRIFEMHFDQAHENFFRRLKTDFPGLTPNDLKLCAYLRLNLSSKEIAPLLNISVRGVEIRRYRLRKRLLLKTEDNLIEFLMDF